MAQTTPTIVSANFLCRSQKQRQLKGRLVSLTAQRNSGNYYAALFPWHAAETTVTNKARYFSRHVKEIVATNSLHYLRQAATETTRTNSRRYFFIASRKQRQLIAALICAVRQRDKADYLPALFLATVKGNRSNYKARYLCDATTETAATIACAILCGEQGNGRAHKQPLRLLAHTFDGIMVGQLNAERPASYKTERGGDASGNVAMCGHVDADVPYSIAHKAHT
jgi:hypothetical protein